MALSREQWLAMQLAGTVSIPPTLPNLVRISLVSTTTGHGNSLGNGKATTRELILTEQSVSARVTIRRYFPIADVTAIQISDAESAMGSGPGVWYLNSEITEGTIAKLLRGAGLWGIAYVREQAQTLMQVDVGMTAAESAEYYPPLPGDRSHDHYQFGTVHDSAAAASAVACSARLTPQEAIPKSSGISWCSNQRIQSSAMLYSRSAAPPNTDSDRAIPLGVNAPRAGEIAKQ